MQGDGLYEPLGQSTVPAKTGGRRTLILSGALAAVAAAAGAAAWYSDHPRPAQTAAVVPITPAPPPAVPAPPPQPAPSTATVADAKAPDAGSGVTVVRPPGAPAATGTFIPVPQPDPLALPAAPDQRLVEQTRSGILPRRGPDGARAADVYARQPPPAAANAKARIALFVGGMGLNAGLTASAAKALPPAVSLGFAPYGTDLDQQVARVRALGHETLLQVPMESFNAPDSAATMPHQLVTGVSARETLDSLHWQMTRFVGYAGLASFLGAKFTADAAAFTPVLKDVNDRGLFYFDDGTAPRSLATSIGATMNLPTVKADVVIDALGDPAVVDAGLRKLEKLALSKGVAVGATTGLPTTVDRVAAFTTGLEAEGIVLVPVSALAEAGGASSSQR